MLDIREINARKSKKKLYSSMAAMGFVHKEVRGGINHAHTTKEVMGIRILSVLTSLLLVFLNSYREVHKRTEISM